MKNTELPQWLNDIENGTVAVLTLDDGERLTADILRLNDDNELVVDVVSSNRSYDGKARRGRSIPVNRVVSVEIRPRAEQPWPYSDPCRVVSSSFGRVAFLSALFLGMTVGGLPLFLFLTKRPYGLQAASAIVYTMFAVFFTFARTGSGPSGRKDVPPYRFTCPAVQPQLSRLLRRHLGFLIALFTLETLALAVRPNLPEWWSTNAKGPPFEIALVFLCFGLAWTQVVTNRRLLDRAHREFTPT